MKRIFRTVYTATLVTVLAACTPQTVELPGNGDISIIAGVKPVAGIVEAGTSRAVVEAVEYRGINPADNPFVAEVWFTETSGEYKHEPDYTGEGATCLPIHTYMTFDRNTRIFPPEHTPEGSAASYKLKYPKDGSKACCVGFYSNHWTGNGTLAHASSALWASSDNKTATHDIDGKTDLMYAPQVEGSRTTPFDTLRFHHLQTWLKLNVYADDEEAAKNWGKITSIEVTSNKTVSVDLGATEVNKTTVTYTGTQLLTITGNHSLTTDVTEVGSLFCSPETEYTLTIKTAYNEKTLTIPICDKAGSAITDIDKIRGRLFVINLLFKPYSVVEGVCTLNAWENQDEDLYPNT